MCGLTIDKINSKGGNNVNKHLAYMALSNSATDEWEEFDIDKSIVIDDFETNVYGTFDFVDETDYSITRKLTMFLSHILMELECITVTINEELYVQISLG